MQSEFRQASIGIGLLAVFLVNPVWFAQARQVDEPEWSEPRRLSSLRGEASPAYMASDGFGNLHLFWVESGFDDERSLIQYSRFDGENWTSPFDVYASWPRTSIGSVSPFIDQEGTIHLAWTEGNSGPLYYARSSIDDALSPKGWSAPVVVDVPSRDVSLNVEENGVIHVLYINRDKEDAGVYHVRSENLGRSWSRAVQLDPDIPLNAIPLWLDTELDDNEGLHVLWGYADSAASNFAGRWVRYSHSLDGGDNWSEPFSIDLANEGEQDEIRMPHPGLAVQGTTIHAIWGGTAEDGGSSVNRLYRYSLDRGDTWSEIAPIMGELEGQAGGDGLAIDGAGRLHFVGQLRWPHGVYHAVYDGGSWSEPQLAYLIRETAFEDIGRRIHAHNVRLSVSGGNQLVAAFTTDRSVQSVLYTIQYLLPDIESIATLPVVQEVDIPVDEATPIPQETSLTATPHSTAETLGAATLDRTRSRTAEQRNASLALGGGIAFLVVAGVVISQIVVRKV